jgi:hypothetical protein
VTAILEYRRSRGAVYPLVVSCRTEAYRSLTTPLRPRRTIVMQRLSMADVDRHLRAGGRDFAGVRDAIAENMQLAEMARTPLFLAMITYTYRGRTPPVNPRQTLFDDYVTRRLYGEFPGKPQLAPGSPPPAAERVLHWLSWLARSMKANNQAIFHPDLMQPDLLSSRLHRRLVRPGVAIAVGLAAAALFGPIFWFAFATISTQTAGNPDAGVAAGVIAATLSGLACAWQCLRRRIEPTRPPRDPVSQLRRSLLRVGICVVIGAGLGALAGSWFGYMDAEGALGPASYAIVGVLGWHLGGVPGGTTLGVIVGGSLGVVSSIQTEPNIRPARPGIGMRETARIAVTAGTVTTALGIITYGVLGLPLGALVALRIGGAAYMAHTVLRLLLAREKAMPRRMLAFLHHLHTLTLLSEIGGGYKFTHPLLHDYFAHTAKAVTDGHRPVERDQGR